MILTAINMGILTIIFFIVGMIKPEWVLFFMKEPSRFIVLVISTVLIMISVTLYGEGHRRATLAQEVNLPSPQGPVPVPVPEAPKSQ